MFMKQNMSRKCFYDKMAKYENVHQRKMGMIEDAFGSIFFNDEDTESKMS